jgi:hypothetical protein
MNSEEKNIQNHAERFMEIVAILDKCKESYRRTVPHKACEEDYPPEKDGESYLITHLKNWLSSKIEEQKVFTTRTGEIHVAMKSNGKDLRRNLPTTINAEMQKHCMEWDRKKRVTVTWIVCYLNKVFPNQTCENWKFFECSHLCVEYGLKPEFNCIDGGCLAWESKSTNQSRGNDYCMKICNHCSSRCCHCQGFHFPGCK